MENEAMKIGDIVTLRHNYNLTLYKQYGRIYSIHQGVYYSFRFYKTAQQLHTKLPYEFQYVNCEFDNNVHIGFPRCLLKTVDEFTNEERLHYSLWKMKQ